MEMEFVKALAKFTVAVAIVAAVLLVALGAALLLFPEAFFTALAWALGGSCLLSGLALLGSLTAGSLTRGSKGERP